MDYDKARPLLTLFQGPTDSKLDASSRRPNCSRSPVRVDPARRSSFAPTDYNMMYASGASDSVSDARA